MPMGRYSIFCMISLSGCALYVNRVDFVIFNEVNIKLLTEVFKNELPADDARIKAEKEQREALPDGNKTEGQFLFSIVDNSKFLG